MKLTIEFPESPTPRTHVAARVAAEYVACEIGKLPASAWTDMRRDGSIGGRVDADFVGVVEWTVVGDR